MISMRLLRVGLLGMLAIASVTSVVVTIQLRGDPAPDVPELSASPQIRRSNPEPNTVSIEITNHGDVPVRVRQAELVSESFAATGPQPVDVEVPAHAAPRDIGIGYGRAQCGGELEPSAAAATARLELSADGGQWQQMELKLPHPDGVLERLLREACAEQYLGERVTVGFGDWNTADDDGLRGSLELTRLDGDADIEVYNIAGSVLYTLAGETGTPPIGRLEAGDTHASLPVTADTARCDSHGLADVKKPFVFTVWLAVAGAEPAALTIPVTETDTTALVELQARRC